MFGLGGYGRQGEKITTDQLKSLLGIEPRRHRLSDATWGNLPWTALRAPVQDGTDWVLMFPFFETFCPAFDEFCLAQAKVATIEKLPFERNDGTRVRYTYLKSADEQLLKDIGKWLGLISSFVGIKDFLRVPFALDYTREGGKPDEGLTHTAKLRRTAKLYGGSDEPSPENLTAASKLAAISIKFIERSQAYYQADSVIAIPRSDPAKTYSLPGYIAEYVAKELGLTDLSDCIRTSRARREMKKTPAPQRLQELEGTIEVFEPSSVAGKRILIVDDLYQSGTTMNYVGKLLLDSSAS